MKVTSFHFMPYRDLPDDYPKGLDSAWVDAPWWEYGDANKVSDFYNWSIDELMLAARLGFDGIGTNEHHQNPYGFMCNPNLFGAILAKMTRDQGLDDVALVQLGATLAATSPLARGHRSDAEGVDREGILCLEWQILSAPESEFVAAAGAGSAPAAPGARRRKLIDLGLLPRR